MKKRGNIGNKIKGSFAIFKMFVIAIILFLNLFNFVLAQEVQEENLNERLMEEAQVIATTNIYNANIVLQKENTIRIYFVLNNREKSQPQIRYSVQLHKKDESGDFLKIDEKVYDEVVSLNANESIEKDIEYAAPEYLKGDYELWLYALNESGTPLALASLGQVSLNGTGRYLEIDPNYCYLQVEGENTEEKYALTRGVDIEKEESLRATCKVVNNFQEEKKFKYDFEIYRRSTLGEKASFFENIDRETVLRINPNEEKLIYFIVPKPEKAQAYNAILTLKSAESQEIISNSIAIHYVLRGPSATIINARLDKDFYKEGETAKLSFTWAPSADNFPESRLKDTLQENFKLEGEIINCSSNYSQNLDEKEYTFEIDYAINKDCVNPNLILAIKDSKGNILDRRNYEFRTMEENIPAPPIEETKNKTQAQEKEDREIYLLIVGFLIILFIISLGIVLVLSRKRKINKNVTGLLFFLVFASIFLLFGGKKVQADTFCDRWGECYVLNLNKSTYDPGESMRAYVSFQVYRYRGAAYYVIPPAYCFGKTNTSSLIKFPNSIRNATYRYSSSIYTRSPNSTGNYRAYFGWGNYGSCSRFSPYYQIFSIPYSVRQVCSVNSWSPSASTVCSGTRFNQVSNCGTIRQATGTKCCNTSWSPEPSEYCDEEDFTQTSNCGETRQATGTKCCNTSWAPDSSEYCDEESFTQTSNCGDTRIIDGTMTTQWIPQENTKCTSESFTQTSTNCNITQTRASNGLIPLISGVCGDANGSILSEEPNSDLCNSGTLLNPPGVTGTGPWYWTCEGICGGSDVNCSAKRNTNWREVSP